MKTRWKVLIGVGIVLVALLALNTIVVNQQTERAEVNVDGAQIISLPGGDVQVLEEPAEAKKPGAPIVLIHCYSCSMRWWDQLAPLLTPNHRVIRIDVLGHGGSEKPASGYSMENQAQLVAGALNKLDVQGAVVVGQSMGSEIAVALAAQSSQLVDRVIDMSMAPTNDSNSLPLIARLESVPVLGQAMYRLAPDFAIRSGFKEAFAPGFEVPPDFEDIIVEDYRELTYTAYDEVQKGIEEYRDEEPLDERIIAAAVPLMVILGEEDQIVDTAEAREDWSDVPGVRITTLPGVGHTPQVEAPDASAALIEQFAADAGPEVLPEAPGADAKPKKKDNKNKKNDRKPTKKDKRKSRLHEAGDGKPG
jgi:pimeloyl-ACP methyl ester carboxylesterase